MNNTQTIKWHEECFGNWKKSLDKHEERTLQELEKIKQDRVRLNFYDDQIKSAKIIGKLRFDRERYKVKRKPQHPIIADKQNPPIEDYVNYSQTDRGKQELKDLGFKKAD